MRETKCFFDVSIAGQSQERIVFKLFDSECPRTCENFRCLCTGEGGLGKKSGKPLHYKGSGFHRVVRNFIIQGGDITDGNGKGGDSIFGGSFADENLNRAHNEPFLLSMANKGPDTNRSQFFITTKEAPHLDGKHVVFGRVISGFDTVTAIENCEVNSNSRPLDAITITDCGTLASISSPKDSRGTKRKLPTSRASSIESRASSTRRERTRSPTSCESSFSSSCSSSTLSDSLRSSRDEKCDSASNHSSNYDHVSKRTSNKSPALASNFRDVSHSRLDVRYNKTKLARREPANSLESFVSPHYKCSVKPDEVPEVPVNRFLLRGPIKGRSPEVSGIAERRSDKSPVRVESTDEDEVDHQNNENNDHESEPSNSCSKPKEPIVSKSGRIMKGRGTFKFRTPSPDSRGDRERYDGRYYSKNRHRSPDRSRSPPRHRHKDYERRHRHKRDR